MGLELRGLTGIPVVTTVTDSTRNLPKTDHVGKAAGTRWERSPGGDSVFWANIPEFLIRPFNDCLGASGLRQVHRSGQESWRGGGGRRKNLSVRRIIKTLWQIIKTHFFPFPSNGKQR